MQAILSNAQHPEYGEVTIPFPIGENEYGRCLELLGKMEIGNPIERDCFIREIQHGPSILQQLVGCNVTVDELDYLAKRLDSFDDRETAKFQGAAVSCGCHGIVDLINLTFSCQQVTIITDFSDLEEIGQNHYMDLNGGTARAEELENLDGYETALLLIEGGGGTITPYGVVYDNCWTHGGEISTNDRVYGYIAETEHYRFCLRCTPRPGDYQGYLYCYDLREQQMRQRERLVGRVTYANGEQQEFTDPQEYLRTIQEELPYRNTTGFRHETLTDDPSVREAVDDILWDFVGEENPRRTNREITFGGLGK